MRAVWVEYLVDGTYAISAEHHDAIVYKADSIEDAVKQYETDQDCVVGVVHHWEDISGHSEQLMLCDI